MPFSQIFPPSPSPTESIRLTAVWRAGGRGQQACSVQEVCVASNVAWSSGMEVGDGGDSIKRYLRKKSDSL